MSASDVDEIADEELLETLGIDEDDFEQAIAAMQDEDSSVNNDADSVTPLTILTLPGETMNAAFARAELRPDIQAAYSIMGLNQGRFANDHDVIDVNELVSQLEGQAANLLDGDLSTAESTLAAQICTLDALFHALLRRSGNNMGVYVETAWEYMKLALKAQSQCRATIKALSDLKKPPPEILKQTNIAHGHQQVNNQLAATDEDEIPPNEQMEQQHERMDARAPQETVKSDQAVETVDEEHGTEDT